MNLRTCRSVYPQLHEALANIDEGELHHHLLAVAGDVETLRPFASYPVALVAAYREFPLLVVRELRRYAESGQLQPWYESVRVRQFLLSIFSPDRLQELMACDLGKFRTVQNALEDRLLERLAPIVSGEEGAEVGLRQATAIANAVALVSRGA